MNCYYFELCVTWVGGYVLRVGGWYDVGRFVELGVFRVGDLGLQVVIFGGFSFSR